MNKQNDFTRWDRYAAAALSGVAANENSGCNSPRDLAHWAASVADAMLRESAVRMADAGPAAPADPT